MKTWLKWIGESLTYRLEDFFGAWAAGWLVGWYFTGKIDLGFDIGISAALLENTVASCWYLINRKLWNKVKEVEKHG